MSLENGDETVYIFAMQACQAWLNKQPMASDLGNFAEVARRNTDYAHSMTRLCQAVGLGHKL